MIGYQRSSVEIVRVHTAMGPLDLQIHCKQLKLLGSDAENNV